MSKVARSEKKREPDLELAHGKNIYLITSRCAKIPSRYVTAPNIVEAVTRYIEEFKELDEKYLTDITAIEEIAEYPDILY